MVLVLKERGVGFKGTRKLPLKTKFILLAIHCNFIYFQGILFLFHLISPTVYKYHIIQQTITSPNKKTKDHRQNEQNNSQTEFSQTYQDIKIKIISRIHRVIGVEEVLLNPKCIKCPDNNFPTFAF